MKNQQLHKLLAEEIQDMYSAEKQIVDSEPQFIDKATNPQLKEALQNNIDESKEQLKEIEAMAALLEISLEGMKCLGMDGIIKDAQQHLKDLQPSPETDLTIIALAQRIEHYEIAGYGTAKNYAEKMEHTEAMKFLDKMADEEGEQDKKLTSLADSLISSAIS